MSGLSKLISKEEGVPIDSLLPMASTLDKYIAPDGSEWLKSGVLETNLLAYPDATKTLPFNLDTYLYNSKFTVASTYGKAISFSASGNYMYVSYYSNQARIYQYTLSTPWNISTAVSTHGTFKALSGGQYYIESNMIWNSDGTILITMDGINSKVYKYIITTPWDVATAVYNSVFTVSNLYGIYISQDGTKMYLTTNSALIRYTLNSAWDITSAVQVASISGYNSNNKGIVFSPDGTKFFTVINDTIDKINEYNVTIPWDITTLILKSSKILTTNSAPVGFFINGTNMYTVNAVTYYVEQYDFIEGVGIANQIITTSAPTPIYIKIK